VFFFFCSPILNDQNRLQEESPNWRCLERVESKPTQRKKFDTLFGKKNTPIVNSLQMIRK